MHTTIEFEHQDWLGTERLETACNGQVLGSSASLPFGDGFSSTNVCDEPGHYATLDQDSTSNEHAQFREYSNMAGRWFSPDPYHGSYDPTNPQTFNRYTYALNNPLSFIDPTGLDECDIIEEPIDVGGDIGYQPIVVCIDGGSGGGAGGAGNAGGTAPSNSPPCLTGAGPLMPSPQLVGHTTFRERLEGLRLPVITTYRHVRQCVPGTYFNCYSVQVENCGLTYCAADYVPFQQLAPGVYVPKPNANLVQMSTRCATIIPQ